MGLRSLPYSLENHTPSHTRKLFHKFSLSRKVGLAIRQSFLPMSVTNNRIWEGIRVWHGWDQTDTNEEQVRLSWLCFNVHSLSRSLSSPSSACLHASTPKGSNFHITLSWGTKNHFYTKSSSVNQVRKQEGLGATMSPGSLHSAGLFPSLSIPHPHNHRGHRLFTSTGSSKSSQDSELAAWSKAHKYAFLKSEFLHHTS